MKSIGLITYYNSDNYGAMLQAYALQCEIRNNGCNCLIISHDRFSTKQTELAGQFNNRKIGRIMKLVSTGIKYPRSIFMILGSQTKEIRRAKKRQAIKCAAFREEYFPNRSEVFFYTTDQIMKEPPLCDGYVCGSDQIWNPERFEGAEPFYLAFAPEGRNRIAYAPSVAMTHIPDDMKEQYKSLISKFTDVSVREKNGCAAIEKATGIMPKWVMDPTFLLSVQEWKSFSNVKLDVPERYIFCYFLGKENLLCSRPTINKLANKLNAKIIVLPYGEHKADKKWTGIEDAGPREFVALIRNAEYIMTDSFHGTALSIILNKNFSVYSGTNTASFVNRFDRIANLLKICGLESRAFTNKYDFRDTSIDFLTVFKLLSPMIKQSRCFLKQALDKVVEKKGTDKQVVPTLASFESCTGCSSCYAVCPKHAISMQLNKSGFWYPAIDEVSCVNCGKCEKICPVRFPIPKNENPKEYLAIYATDKEFRSKGSSGNAFGLFAQLILRNGGDVFGAVLSDNCRKLCFQSAVDVGIEKLQKSKYFEAEMGDVILRIKSILDNGKEVMFTGTPCQAAGLRKYFGNHPHLLICDFICHGVPSAEWFGRYLSEMEKKYGANAINVSFRSKALGWRLYCMKIDFANGKKYLKTQFADPYFIDFFQNKHLRTNCYSCNRVIRSCADVTFGDYWAVNVKHNITDTDEGISIVCLRTKKGKEFFSQVASGKEDIFVQPLREDEVDETFVSRVRKPPKGHDILSEKFDINPHLSVKSKLKKVYYEHFIKYLQLRK